MTTINKKVEELLAKHPNLSQPEAIKIVAEKNERKNKKRSEKTNKGSVKKLKRRPITPNVSEA
jgi:uncharacterized protein YoaH (UPF0181 family)